MQKNDNNTVGHELERVCNIWKQHGGLPVRVTDVPEQEESIPVGMCILRLQLDQVKMYSAYSPNTQFTWVRKQRRKWKVFRIMGPEESLRAVLSPVEGMKVFCSEGSSNFLRTRMDALVLSTPGSEPCSSFLALREDLGHTSSSFCSSVSIKHLTFIIKSPNYSSDN